MSKMTSQDKYEKKNIQRVVLKLNKNTDKDILEWINSQDNKQGAIKEIIRKHLKESE